MSLLLKMKELAEKAKQKAGDFTDGSFSWLRSGSSSAKDFGGDFDISVKISGNEIKNINTTITGVMVDSGMPPEAGVCEVHMMVLGYRIEKNKMKLDKEFSQIKVGQPLEIGIANVGEHEKFFTVFTGFVEKIEFEINSDGTVHFTVHGMDAKMWMMANKLTESRGTGNSYEQIIKSVINNYRSQAKIGKMSLLKNVQIQNTFYQVNQSDYEFLCMMADLTGSLFYVGPDGKINFCAPSKLMKPVNEINFKDDVVTGIKFSASVWGTPRAVKVTTTNRYDPSKTISAICSEVKSVSSGKAPNQVVPQNCSSQSAGTRYVNITDNSMESKEQAQARADAEFDRRNFRFVETELTTKGNPKLRVGQGVKLSGFDEPIGNEYLVVRVKHEWASQGSMYDTTMYLAANRFKPQGR